MRTKTQQHTNIHIQVVKGTTSYLLLAKAIFLFRLYAYCSLFHAEMASIKAFGP